MSKPMTVTQFLRLFPDDDACLAHLFEVRFGSNPKCPKCGQVGTFHKLAKLPAYTCNCGHHIHPMVDTPFHRSRTPLQKWFFAMFLFTTTRNGVAAKEIQRQLGVTYKTAWRIARLIREYMGWVDGDTPLGGSGGSIVEADEAFIGGKDKIGASDKTIVFGMAERGGDVITRIVPDRSEFSSSPVIRRTSVRVRKSQPTNGPATSVWARKVSPMGASTTPPRNGSAASGTRTLSEASGAW